jgi:hypothetical protein
MLPNSCTQVLTALWTLSMLLTSTAPRPRTLLPFRAVAISFAMPSVFSTLRPTMQALAPRWTRARTWALHIEPLPPVQKMTLFLKRSSFHTSLRYSCFCIGIVRGVPVQMLRSRVARWVRECGCRLGCEMGRREEMARIGAGNCSSERTYVNGRKLAISS